MILRRISEAIRNQDWFVVVLEVMIVVVGIFIGLQVDDWNENRKDEDLEIAYLKGIKANIVDDINELELHFVADTTNFEWKAPTIKANK